MWLLQRKTLEVTVLEAGRVPMRLRLETGKNAWMNQSLIFHDPSIDDNPVVCGQNKLTQEQFILYQVEWNWWNIAEPFWIRDGK